jgi:hypothetical protein
MAGAAANRGVEKDARTETVSSARQWRARIAALLLAAAVLAGAGRAAEDLAQLQARFDQERDGVRKAKLLQKLGDAQFNKEREAAKNNDYSTVGLEMEKYRDNVRAALEALKRTHPEAEKHSSGYKQLEIHVGKGLREIRDVILAMPEPLRPPMQLVEQDLRDLDMELLRLLFPRRPGEKPPMQPNAASPGKPEAKVEKQP